MKRYVDILLALAALAWVGFFTVRSLTQPFYPMWIAGGGEVTNTWDGAVVRRGDLVERMNGRPLAAFDDAQRAGEEAERREPLRLRIVRDGARLDVVQPPVTAPAMVRVGQVASGVVGIIFVAMGLVVALRPTAKPGKLFFLFSLCMALFITHSGFSIGLDTVVALAAQLLAPAFLVHFFLRFPHTHPLARRFPWLPGVLYAPPIAFVLLVQGLALASRLSFVPMVLVETLLRGAALFMVVYFLWAVLTFVDSYRRLEEPLEREKLRWVVWGVVISILPAALAIGAQVLFGVILPYFDIWASVLLLALPLSFAYAILSHRLMDIDIVLNRGLVYTAITAVLVVVFVVVENTLAALSLELTGTSSFALAMGAAVVMAAVVDPVRRRMQLFVDTLFFAYKVKLREGLKDLAEELSFITDLERMERVLLRRLADLAHVARAALFLREEEGGGYVLNEAVGISGWERAAGQDAEESRSAAGEGETDGARGVRFDANDSFVIWLLRESRPISFETLPQAEFHQRVEGPEVEILARADAALGLPLRLRGDLIGFILLGRRLNRELFNRDEVDLLNRLAIQAAADLTNARLQTRSRRLEEELVTVREEVLAGLRSFLAGPSGSASFLAAGVEPPSRRRALGPEDR